MCEQNNGQEEDSKYMRRCCVKVTPYLSEIVQKTAFSNNVFWSSTPRDNVKNLSASYLEILVNDIYKIPSLCYFDKQDTSDKLLSLEDFLVELAKPVKPAEEIIKVADEPIIFGPTPNQSGIEYRGMAYSRSEIKKILAAWDAVQIAPELTTCPVRFVQNQGIEFGCKFFSKNTIEKIRKRLEL